MSGLARIAAGLLVLALCSGCGATDPYERDDLWQPEGAVQGNMAAMVADPHDLVAGHGPASPAAYGTHAVEDLWNGHPKALLSSTAATDSGSGPSGGAPSPGGD